VYKLPDQVALKVQEQYERDVARLHGGPVVSSEAEYKAFLAELGGAPPPELMGLDASGGVMCVCLCVCARARVCVCVCVCVCVRSAA
jgi:hypothetical protein